MSIGSHITFLYFRLGKGVMRGNLCFFFHMGGVFGNDRIGGELVGRSSIRGFEKIYFPGFLFFDSFSSPLSNSALDFCSVNNSSLFHFTSRSLGEARSLLHGFLRQ